MRNEEVLECGGPTQTLTEQWNLGPRNRQHWYNASTEFAKEGLGAGNGRSCLVIGSPLFEAMELRKQGWDVTYMDVRRPPVIVGKFLQCDATDITLPHGSFDAVSTACVLTHAGTGRYGDGHNREHGDEVMLGHIARVLKPGSAAAITFGAVADIPKMARLGSAHRIYNVPECRMMLAAASLKITKMRVWSWEKKGWLGDDEPITKSLDKPDYISFMVTK
jgi:hypothetical protein